MSAEDAISGLPPSAKLVYKVIEYHGPLTQQAIIEKTRLPSRTVRDAIGRLSKIDSINKQAHLQDVRQNLYSLSADRETVNEHGQR